MISNPDFAIERLENSVNSALNGTISKLRRIRQQGEGSEDSVNRDFKSEVKTTVHTCDNDTSSNA